MSLEWWGYVILEEAGVFAEVGSTARGFPQHTAALLLPDPD